MIQPRFVDTYSYQTALLVPSVSWKIYGHPTNFNYFVNWDNPAAGSISVPINQAGVYTVKVIGIPAVGSTSTGTTVCDIYSGNIEIKESNSYSEVNIFEAEDPKHKKLEYVIFFDNKLPIKQVSKLYREVVTQLFDLQPELFFTTDMGESINLKRTSSKDLLRQPMQITENYYVESNMDSVNKFNKIKKLLSTFEFEDELIIKYAD